jgi:2,4-dienoyl-CoA reductase-like NADH-dependent reductase (Old Yellow Enzyme family)/thioredoxin reductase
MPSDRPFPRLFSPLTIGPITLKNRIVSTGHDTVMAENGKIGDRLIAYHEARARGGCGLIVVQVAGVHDSARYSSEKLMCHDDECLPGYRRLAETVHRFGTKLFGQLFHPGREIMNGQDGTVPIAYAPSATPSDRFHVIPRALSRKMIAELTDAFATGAVRLKQAGLDGCEIVASQNYLPAQFLNPSINRRDDEYGGSLTNRMRFLREIIDKTRQSVGAGFVIGARISGDERDYHALETAEVLQICSSLRGLDYLNVTAGSSATLQGAIHIVPPMAYATAYVAPLSAAIKSQTGVPIIVTGRINQPQIAEEVIARGEADACGMTRAMICDPQMPAKAEAGRTDDIRACIACNQACIGHFHKGYPISCIQHPETGRELQYGRLKPVRQPKRVLVAGGGPAGMKAAAVLAARGHVVTLCEASGQLGGQALLAQLLPGRAEFGGIITNLTREMDLAGVEIKRNIKVSRDTVNSLKPDAIVIATGALPHWPAFEGRESMHTVDAWQVLMGQANVGASVVIADWRSDWIGMGLAEKLARDGCRVRLCVNGLMAGELVPWYVRDHQVGELHKLGVEIITYARLYGADGDTIYMQHTSNGEAIVLNEVDTLVLAQGHESVQSLEDELEDWPGEIHMIGDAASPRTAEEAVLEGLKVACFI